ncbi:MAG TPA: hypothetical protein VGB30_08740 [bacterium]|jgi:hypothetical protein
MSAAVWMVMIFWLKSAKSGNNHRYTILLAWMLGFLSGFRPGFLIFALPAVAWLIYRKNPGSWLNFVIHLVISSLVWIIPLLVFSGGIGNYLIAMQAEAGPFARPIDIQNITANLDMLIDSLHGMMPLVWIISVVWLAVSVIRGLMKYKSGIPELYSILIILWIMPALLIYLKNILHPGYTLFFLPIIVIGVIGAWTTLYDFFIRSNMLGRIFIPILILPTIIFLLQGLEWGGAVNSFFPIVTIQKSQTSLSELHSTITENFTPENCAFVTWEHFRDAGWAIPETYVIYPQAVYSNFYGSPPERANLYMMHDHRTIPPAFHMVRDIPIQPVILPENVEYVITMASELEHYSGEGEFNEIQVKGNMYLYWKKLDAPIEIGIDGDNWYCRTKQ